MSPLPDRIRPTKISQFIGQSHLVGNNKPITLAIAHNEVQSMIFWGPPGCGKTTLARIISNEIDAEFFHLSAVSAGKSDVRKVIDQAINFAKTSRNTVLFLDEIHRFNKVQQDYLLPYVEDGTIVLIGATTENPSFKVISPLLSRTHIYVLNQLQDDDIMKIIESGIKELKIKISDDAKQFIATYSNGDGRKSLNLLESTSKLYGSITLENLKSTLQSTYLRYDQSGEQHYDTISAFIKSMRASQSDAAIYYLARMVEAGEDPLFIARRMVVFASEDIGIAQPTALVVANAVYRACETIGYPECAINLAHGVIYLSEAKKDRSSYDALRAAEQDVKSFSNLEIPLHLRNAPTKLMKDLGYGKGYNKYNQDSYLPTKINKKKYLKK